MDRPKVDTLYLGGGTPSLLSPEELGALTEAIRAAFDLSGLAEATLEANPGTVDLAWLQGARALGWDRISLGVQTLDDELLKRLGRIHDAREALCCAPLLEPRLDHAQDVGGALVPLPDRLRQPVVELLFESHGASSCGLRVEG